MQNTTEGVPFCRKLFAEYGGAKKGAEVFLSNTIVAVQGQKMRHHVFTLIATNYNYRKFLGFLAN